MYHFITPGEFSLTEGRHVPQGLRQFRACARHLANISCVVVGLDSLTQEMKTDLQGEMILPSTVEVWGSPFCTLGALVADNSPIIRLTNHWSSCNRAHYVGLASPYFEPWGFVRSFAEGALFLAGDELLLALGASEVERGALYRLDPTDQSIARIMKG
jgi:hypothetical protein